MRKLFNPDDFLADDLPEENTEPPKLPGLSNEQLTSLAKALREVLQEASATTTNLPPPVPSSPAPSPLPFGVFPGLYPGFFSPLSEMPAKGPFCSAQASLLCIAGDTVQTEEGKKRKTRPWEESQGPAQNFGNDDLSLIAAIGVGVGFGLKCGYEAGFKDGFEVGAKSSPLPPGDLRQSASLVSPSSTASLPEVVVLGGPGDKDDLSFEKDEEDDSMYCITPTPR